MPNEESNGTSWSQGGPGMGYRAWGDPDGPDDGHPGSLISIGHPRQGMVSEFDVPRPVRSTSRNLAELPVARTLHPFVDVTGGRHTPRLTAPALTDVEYLNAPEGGGRLFWVMYEFYLPPPDMPTLGWCESRRQPDGCYGVWTIGNFPSAATSRYLFEIPAVWADRHVGGKRLAAGRFRVARGGSWGPALYAVEEGDLVDPGQGTATARATELLKYRNKSPLRGFSNADDWADGVWLTAGSRSAVVIAGTKAERSRRAGQYYGRPRSYGCGAKGYHAEPYYGALLFYDATELTGARLSQPQPYALFQIENVLFAEGCRRFKIGGVAFDRARGLFYLMERRVDAGKPIVHVWRVTDSGAGPDETPPSKPGPPRVVRSTDPQLELVWERSQDDVGGVVYVVYQDGSPVGMTVAPRFRLHPLASAEHHRYVVEARDSVNNRSERSAAVEVPRSTAR